MREILDGVLINVNNLDRFQIERLSNMLKEIFIRFPGSDKLSLIFSSENLDEPDWIATCDDGEVDGENLNIYDFIFCAIYE